MEQDITNLLYFYSATAQTLGAMLGIGLVALTFYASWMNQRKAELRELVIGILPQYAFAVGKYSSEVQILKEMDRFFTLFENKPDIKGEEKEWLHICKQYQSFQYIIPDKTFLVGLIVTSFTIFLCLAMLILINITMQYTWLPHLIYMITLLLSIASLSIFGYLAWYAVKSISHLRK